MDRQIIPLVLSLIVLLVATAGDAEATATAPTPSDDSSVTEYLPESLLEKYESVQTIPMIELITSLTQHFRQCANCKCCNRSGCKLMKCCYGIVCNVPGKTFGHCSIQLVPKACNCVNCN